MSLVVQRIEILACVLPCIPVKIELELVTGFHNTLLLLVPSKVLLLDQLELLFLLTIQSKRSGNRDQGVSR